MKHRKLAGCFMAAAMLLMSATGTVFATQGSAMETQDGSEIAEPYIMVSIDGETALMYTDERPDEAAAAAAATATGEDSLMDILNRVEVDAPAPDLKVLLEILDPETAAAQSEVQEVANSQRSVANQLIQGLRSSRSRSETASPKRTPLLLSQWQ